MFGKKKQQIRALCAQAQEISNKYPLTEESKTWLEKIEQAFGKV